MWVSDFNQTNMIEVVDATKGDDSIVHNDNSDKKDDQRSHKKRLRLKQRSEKQEEVLKILEKFYSIISEKNDLEDIFQSVKIRKVQIKLHSMFKWYGFI